LFLSWVILSFQQFASDHLFLAFREHLDFFPITILDEDVSMLTYLVDERRKIVIAEIYYKGSFKGRNAYVKILDKTESNTLIVEEEELRPRFRVMPNDEGTEIFVQELRPNKLIVRARPIVEDRTIVASAPLHGGINFNPDLLDLQIKRDGNGVPLPVFQQPIADMDIQGFIPVIINVTPVSNLRLLLGLDDTEGDSNDIGLDFELQPMKEIDRLELA